MHHYVPVEHLVQVALGRHIVDALLERPAATDARARVGQNAHGDQADVGHSAEVLDVRAPPDVADDDDRLGG